MRKLEESIISDVIIDTGPIVAFFDESDRYCIPFRNFLKGFRGRLCTTVAVITEASYLLDECKPVQLDLMEWIKDGAIEIREISNSDFSLIHKYMTKYRDTPMDFADASLVILANKMKTDRILTLDSDFDVYRTVSGKKFKNLLKDILKH